MNVIDKTFKIGMLIVAIVFVIFYYMSLQNGRYYFINEEYGYKIFDTRNGIVMKTSGNEIISYNFSDKTRTHSRIRYYKED